MRKYFHKTTSFKVALAFGICMLIIYVRGLFIPLMNNDSAHHAMIAMNMVNTGDYFSLMERDHDYLDKPHFLFWTAALSFNVFGVNAFAYKFPSFLFTLLALYATFKLALLLYGLRGALWSAAMLASSYAFLLANNDVRMDAVLASTIIFAIWQLVLFIRTGGWVSLLSASLGMAMAFSTKGIIGIAMPMLVALLYIVQERQWQQFRNLKWVAMGAITLILLVPVFYSFYIQFDLHPEKVIRGTTGNSGVRFLLLGQSIKRYSGTAWGASGSDDPFLFLHTFLWAFLPWSLIAYLVWFRSMRSWFSAGQDKKIFSKVIFISIALVFLFLLISGSRFKLPHYLNILLPLFAVLTAAAFQKRTRYSQWMQGLQWVALACLVIIMLGTNGYMFVPNNWIVTVTAIVLVLLVGWVLLKTKFNVWAASLASTLLFYFLLNFNFFPQLLQSQAGQNLGVYAQNHNLDKCDIYYLQGAEFSNSFDFQLKRRIDFLALEEINSKASQVIIYTGQNGISYLKEAGIAFQEITRVKDFEVTKFRKETLFPSLRAAHHNYHYLVAVNGGMPVAGIRAGAGQ